MPSQGFAPSLDPGSEVWPSVVPAPTLDPLALVRAVLAGDRTALDGIDLQAVFGNFDFAQLLSGGEDQNDPVTRATRLLESFSEVLPKPLIDILTAGLPLDAERFEGGLRATANVNVRDASTSSGDLVVVVPAGGLMFVLATATGQTVSGNAVWYEVELPGSRIRGWAWSGVVEAIPVEDVLAAVSAEGAPRPDTSASPTAGETVTVRGERNVRSGPSATETDVLGTVPDGTVVEVLERREVFAVDPASLPDAPSEDHPLWLRISWAREGEEPLVGWVAAIDASADAGGEGYQESGELAEIWLQGWAPGSGDGLYPSTPQNAGQCVWYAYNRLLEMGYDRRLLDAIRGNGGQWDEAAIAQGGIEQTVPARGDIAVWEISDGSGGDAGTVGHVAVVEEVLAGDADGTRVIVLSEYNWNNDEAYGMRVVREGEGDFPEHFVRLPRGSEDLGVWADWTEAWLEAQQLATSEP
jgi:surface antigen